MKILLCTLSCITFLFSCAQTTKKQKNRSSEYINKIKNNYKNVKSYDYNPIYQVRYENYDCPMELYINDVLVVYLAGGGRSAGEQIVQIPDYILKSGIQSF